MNGSSSVAISIIIIFFVYYYPLTYLNILSINSERLISVEDFDTNERSLVKFPNDGDILDVTLENETNFNGKYNLIEPLNFSH